MLCYLDMNIIRGFSSMIDCNCKILTKIGLFIIIVTSVILFFAEVASRRNLDAKLYIIQLLIENKPKLENEELSQKVNEIYKVISEN